MRVATWNVNSLRARQELVGAWLDEHEPDVLLLQETKVDDRSFPRQLFEERGYHVVTWGANQWNGVAICLRGEPAEVRYGANLARAVDAREEPRALAVLASFGWVLSVYVPNGRALDDPHYRYKLAWLSTLRESLAPIVGDGVIVGGDFNVAPSDLDVWDAQALRGSTHVSQPERSALASLLGLGLHDAFRLAHPDEPGFTWWDYRQGAFRRNFGMRIDLMLVSAGWVSRLSRIEVDREARRAAKPSDHAPLVADFSP